MFTWIEIAIVEFIKNITTTKNCCLIKNRAVLLLISCCFCFFFFFFYTIFSPILVLPRKCILLCVYAIRPLTVCTKCTFSLFKSNTHCTYITSVCVPKRKFWLHSFWMRISFFRHPIISFVRVYAICILLQRKWESNTSFVFLIGLDKKKSNKNEEEKMGKIKSRKAFFFLRCVCLSFYVIQWDDDDGTVRRFLLANILFCFFLFL